MLERDTIAGGISPANPAQCHARSVPADFRGDNAIIGRSELPLNKFECMTDSTPAHNKDDELSPKFQTSQTPLVGSISGFFSRHAGAVVLISFGALVGCSAQNPGDPISTAGESVNEVDSALVAGVDTAGVDSAGVDSAGVNSKSDSNRFFTLAEIEFANIPAGSFMMGASDFQPVNQYNACERPAHEIVLTKSFSMSRHEITVRDFRRFVDATNYATEAELSGIGCNSLNLVDGNIQRLSTTIWSSPGFPQTDSHPVVCVSWNDATAYCEWLTTQIGRHVRLPTEAEWEYCCRAGTTSRFSPGELWSSLQGYCNLGDQSLLKAFSLAGGTADWDDGCEFTCRVGSFRQNAFGLFDMHGNVGEWCLDWFSAKYYSQSPRQNPTGPESPTQWRSVRGGSWYNSPESCRCSGRHDGIETMASTTNGFRVVIADHEN